MLAIDKRWSYLNKRNQITFVPNNENNFNHQKCIFILFFLYNTQEKILDV